MKKDFYCSKCGRKLNTRIVGAENYSIRIKGLHPLARIPYLPYSTKSGKRNLLKEYYCPKYSFFSGFFGRHDKFSNGGIIHE